MVTESREKRENGKQDRIVEMAIADTLEAAEVRAKERAAEVERWKSYTVAIVDMDTDEVVRVLRSAKGWSEALEWNREFMPGDREDRRVCDTYRAKRLSVVCLEPGDPRGAFAEVGQSKDELTKEVN